MNNKHVADTEDSRAEHPSQSVTSEPVAYFIDSSFNENPKYEQVATEYKNDPDVFPLFTSPQPCERCAEFQKNINQLAREQAQKMVNNGTYSDKIRALEAENKNLRHQIAVQEGEFARLVDAQGDRLQATLAQQAERIKELEKHELLFAKLKELLSSIHEV